MNLRLLFLRHVAQTSDIPMMLEVERAEGCRLFDANGNSWIDLISGIGVSNVGHSAPEIVDAIQKQAGKYLHTMVYGEFVQSPQVMYASRLSEVLENNLSHVFFTNSGSEAIEGAMKLSKKATGRHEIIAFNNSYHGATQGALSVTGTPWLKEGYGPLLPEIIHLEFNDADALATISRNTACVIVEPIQAEAGVVLPRPDYLKAIRERCNETGALLVLDESQTGFGRTGTLFAFKEYDIVPDILVLAKALGGGMPLGAFISREQIMRVLMHDPPLGHITTFGGHPVSCAAGLAAFEKIIREDLAARAQEIESIIRSDLFHPAILEKRGKGALFSLKLSGPEKVLDVVRKGLEKGIVVDWFLNAADRIRLAPPLTITDEELKEGLRILAECLNEH